MASFSFQIFIFAFHLDAASQSRSHEWEIIIIIIRLPFSVIIIQSNRKLCIEIGRDWELKQYCTELAGELALNQTDARMSLVWSSSSNSFLLLLLLLLTQICQLRMQVSRPIALGERLSGSDRICWIKIKFSKLKLGFRSKIRFRCARLLRQSE